MKPHSKHCVVTPSSSQIAKWRNAVRARSLRHASMTVALRPWGLGEAASPDRFGSVVDGADGAAVEQCAEHHAHFVLSERRA